MLRPTPNGFLRKQLRVSRSIPAHELIVSFRFRRDRQHSPGDKERVYDQPDLQPSHDFHVTIPFHVSVISAVVYRFGAIVCACTAKECAKIRHGRMPAGGYRAGDACLMWRRAAPSIIVGPSLPAPAFTGSVIRR